ncbi:hypothetical protein NL676_012345 [Syzygium grande]|nr:hypothetical protein NL676_012345 [Syzygium grande]
MRFAYIDSSTHQLSVNSSTEQIFSTFTSTVKRKNPSITTLLSVWAGGEDPSAFVSMLGESSSRRSFIESTIEKARLHGFSGVDLCGVLPSRSINMTNLSALLREWRDGVDAESRKSGKPQLLRLEDSSANAIGHPAVGPAVTADGSFGYKAIRSYIRDFGYGASSVYNGTYVVNFFRKGLVWINFDDVEAIQTKGTYAKEKGLLGYKLTMCFRSTMIRTGSFPGQRRTLKSKGSFSKLYWRITIILCGYVPPEYVRKGIYLRKYDVYSFGVLLLQIISGKRTSCYYSLNENLNLLEYAYEQWKYDKCMEFIDPSLDDSSSSCKLMRCMQVALLCTQEKPGDRPSMLEVSSMLKNESSAVNFPKKPAFSINKDEDEDDKCLHREAIHSVNDASISELFPR